MSLIEKYYKAIEESNLNVTHLTNEFRKLWKSIGDEMIAQGDQTGIKLLELEKDCLILNKSLENGLQPQQTWSGMDEDGKEIQHFYPNHHDFGEKEINYIKERYKVTSNLYLKTEYGLLLLLKNVLVRNDEKQLLSAQLLTYVEAQLNEANEHPELWSRYLFPALNRLMDGFLILSRAGKSLSIEFEKYVQFIQDKFLDEPCDSTSFFHFSPFVVNVFTENPKKVKDLIDTENILKKLEDSMPIIEDSRTSISMAKRILKFTSVFNLVTDKSYHLIIAEKFEKDGDEEIKNERWVQGEKTFEDALKYYVLGKNDEGIKRCKEKINEHKGKFKMGVVSHGPDDAAQERINNHINELIEKGDIMELLLVISGVGVFSKSNTLKEAALKSSQNNSLVNFCTLMAFDKYGNTSRVYLTKEDRLIYHLYSMMNLSCQFGVQIIGHTLKKAIGKKKLSLSHIVGIFMSSWMNEDIEWNRAGELRTIKPVEAVLPGVIEFYSQLSHAIQNSDYEPNFTCAIDSMTTKVEYILRNMCRKLKIPTFKYWYEGEVMLAEEKAMSALLNELDYFLREDDILLIKYLMNDKGGFNIRNRVAHGMVDADEYSYSNALFAFIIILRLAGYDFSEENLEKSV